MRAQLLLDALADAEQVTVSDEELTERIVMQAQRTGMPPEEFVRRIQEAGQLGAIYADVRRTKALIAAVRAATVTDASGERVDLSEVLGSEETGSDGPGRTRPGPRRPDRGDRRRDRGGRGRRRGGCGVHRGRGAGRRGRDRGPAVPNQLIGRRQARPQRTPGPRAAAVTVVRVGSPVETRTRADQQKAG